MNILKHTQAIKNTQNLDDGVLPNFNLKCHEVLHSIDFDVQDIDDRLSKLPCKYSSGPDNIPTVFLKNLQCYCFAFKFNFSKQSECWQTTKYLEKCKYCACV